MSSCLVFLLSECATLDHCIGQAKMHSLTLVVMCVGELYPTEVRTTAHGMSAGVAKVGALWATIWFNYSPLTVARSVM